ncbi:hypothetical protein BDP81DRAFT_455104 [Colletotrichum phormii]|uniref:Delta(24)-sterol reductase n=1 Tax=Colletotrichum phormii TaxID=359342 RepID=A0AAJ0EAL4_9PEZI|nr:uncharacterized protein BDP81DRAFT_455104 [Colletotrichum phormii]KAK1622802.1 hypothetical protein BDP81DRAFT_455104 [Colletotrichum phormii]
MDERIKIEYRLLKHRRRVNIIAAKARRLARDGIKYRIYHKTTNSTRPSTREPEAIIDISGLDQIISIDKRRRRAGVEPNVSMEALVTATLKHGLIPAVVPEFTGITVGGAFSGTALESSSFRYGHFGKSVTSVEVILGNGNIVTVSPVENSDLFSSLSSLWCLWHPRYLHDSRNQACSSSSIRRAQDYTANTSFIDFVDGIMFGPNDGAVIIGTMTDEKKSGMPVTRFSRVHDPWFTLHVHESVPHVRDADCKLCAFSESRSSYKSSIITELVPIKDYLFRYDRAAFWMGIYGRNPNVFNGVTRFMLNPLMKAKSLYAGLHHSGQGQSFFIQDITLPENTVRAFIDWTNEKFGIYPLWICPVRAATDSSSRSNRHRISDMLVNVGVWGLKTIRGPDDIPSLDGAEAFQEFVRDNRAIEQATRDLGGAKMLYATNYYTEEEEFWRIHDKEAHDELRDKWGASGLPSLWDKLGNPNPTYKEKSSRFKVVMKTLLKRNYLLKK